MGHPTKTELTLYRAGRADIEQLQQAPSARYQPKTTNYFTSSNVLYDASGLRADVWTHIRYKNTGGLPCFAC